MHYNFSSSGSNSTYHGQANNGNTDTNFSSSRGVSHNSSAGSTIQYGDNQTEISPNDDSEMWKQTQIYQSYPTVPYVTTYPKQQFYYAPQTYAYRPTQMQWFNRVPTNYQYYYALTYPKSQNSNLWSTGISQSYPATNNPTSSLQSYVSPTYTYPVYTYNASMYNALTGSTSLTPLKKTKKKRKRKNRKKSKENKIPNTENQNFSVETDDPLLPLTIMTNSPSTDDETIDPEFSLSDIRSIDEETDLIFQEELDVDANLFGDESDISFPNKIDKMLDKQEQELKDLFDEFQLNNEDELQFPEFEQDNANKNTEGFSADCMDIIDLDAEFSSKDNLSLISRITENQLENKNVSELHLNSGFLNEKEFNDSISDCGSEDVDFVIQHHTPVEFNYRISPSESLAAEIEMATEKAKRRQGIIFDDDYDCISLNKDEKLFSKEIENFKHNNNKIKGGTRIMLAISKKGKGISYRELQAKEDQLIEQIEKEMDMKQSDSGVQSEESGDENDDLSKSIKMKSMTEEEEDEIWNIEKCNLRLNSMKRTEKSPLIKHIDNSIMPGCGICCVIM